MRNSGLTSRLELSSCASTPPEVSELDPPTMLTPSVWSRLGRTWRTESQSHYFVNCCQRLHGLYTVLYGCARCRIGIYLLACTSSCNSLLAFIYGVGLEEVQECAYTRARVHTQTRARTDTLSLSLSHKHTHTQALALEYSTEHFKRCTLKKRKKIALMSKRTLSCKNQRRVRSSASPRQVAESGRSDV